MLFPIRPAYYCTVQQAISLLFLWRLNLTFVVLERPWKVRYSTDYEELEPLPVQGLVAGG
jgi:hypothetical protein